MVSNGIKPDKSILTDDFELTTLDTLEANHEEQGYQRGDVVNRKRIRMLNKAKLDELTRVNQQIIDSFQNKAFSKHCKSNNIYFSKAANTQKARQVQPKRQV